MKGIVGSLIVCFVIACSVTVDGQSGELTKIGTFGRKTIYAQTKDQSIQWAGAKTFCEKHGMKLASIESIQESNAVSAYLLKVAKAGADAVHGWLGGTDEKSDGHWYWIANGGALKYKNWGAGHPDGATYNNCMYIGPRSGSGDVNSGKWKATYCDIDYARAICHKV